MLLDRINSDYDVLLISAFLPTRSKRENDRLSQELPDKLRQLVNSNSVSSYWIVGHFAGDHGKLENGSTIPEDKIVHCIEYSWVLTRDTSSVSSGQWLSAAIDVAGIFDQSEFIIRLAGETTLRAQDGGIKHLLTDAAIIPTWTELARIRSLQVSENQSSSYIVEGPDKAFPAEFFLACPNSISGRMFFSSKQFRYRIPGRPSNDIPGDRPVGGSVWEPNA